MNPTDFSGHDVVRAHRLVLAVLNDDDAAYATTLAEFATCAGCSLRTIGALVDWVASGLIARGLMGIRRDHRGRIQPCPHPHTLRAQAIAHIEEQLAYALDRLEDGES